MSEPELPLDEAQWQVEGERGRLEAQQLEIDRLRATIARMEDSEAFRIGHRITRAVRLVTHRGRGPLVERREPRPGVAAETPAVPQLTVPPGPERLGPLNDGHATTLIVAWGLEAGDLAALVDDVAALQSMQRHFKPLFVTDSDHAEAFRRHDFAFEHIPSHDDWTRHHPRHEWRDFVDTRIAWLLATYHPTRVLVYEDPVRRDALRHGVLDRLIGAAAAIGPGSRATEP